MDCAMEAEFLKLYEEDFFHGLSSTTNEHENSTEMPQDLLLNIIENDYDMDTSQPITFNSIWSDNERNTDTDASFATKVAASQESENFSKLLTEWQNYVQTVEFEDFKDVINMTLCDTKHTLWNNIHEEETANFSQEMINLEPELKIEKDEQRSVNFEQENTLKIIDTMKINIKTETTKETKEEKVNDLIILPESFQETHGFKKKGANTTNITNKNRNLKEKRKKEKNVIIKNKQEEQEDCIDVETISDEIPVLEAVDIKSLLEQFEASENPNPRNKLTIKNNFLSGTRSNTMQQMIQENQSQLKKPSLQGGFLCNHKNIPDSVSKEVIDRIKASGRKRAISIIPAMPNIQNKNRSSNNTRMQDAGASVSHNKVLKHLTNNTKNRTIDSTLVQLDHDYCYNVDSATKSCDSNKFTKHTSVLRSNQNKKMVKGNGKLTECHNDSNLKKNNNLKSADTCGTSKLEVFTLLDNKTDKTENENRIESAHKDSQKKICLNQSYVLNDSLAIKLPKSVNVSTKSSNKDSPVYLIRSALAQNILRLRNDSKNTSQISSTMQMVSVLKKPPNTSQSLFLKNNSNENIVTTTNSLNNEVKNIIVQDLASDEQAKKPPFRKKLNLAEYRNRMDKNRSDNSGTNFSIHSPMILLYVHHASTTTEPIKNDSENPIWSEREIVPILKSKSDINEEKNKSKPLMCDIGIQTYKTVFEFSKKSFMDTAERNDKREQNIKNMKQKSYKKDILCRSRSRSKSKNKKISKSNSRSRSRSRSRIRSRTRSRSRSRSKNRNRNRSRSRSESRNRSRSRSRSESRNRSRSRSRSRNRSRSKSKSMKNNSRSRSRSTSHRCNHRRRIRSRRRSSVSSTSSWSSQSRSYTTSTRSRYSRSRSRSSRSRSRSFSRYSSCSRSSIYSNYGRSRWSNYRRKSSSDREGSYDRSYKRHSLYNNHRSYKDWRSPVSSYCKSYNWYNREKQKQVEERRVIYVGRLDENVTKADLRRRFEIFGPVVDISVHFREHGDNYGFVTFAYKNDAYTAMEHGNDDPSLPTYDLSFGGRRAFCKYKYSDLDDTASSSPISKSSQANEENTFDFLLEKAKAKLRKRKV